MLRYIGKRILWMIPVIIGVITVVFVLNEITPGDPAREILGLTATEADIQALHEEMGLDKPAVVRYLIYYKNLLKGDLGTSYSTHQPIAKEIIERFPTTLKLAVFSMCVAILLGVTIGVISALRRYTILDIASMSVALLGVSAPNFWLSLILILIFAVNLHWLPSFGLKTAASWILPVCALAFSPMAQIARTTRSSMLEIMSMDYIRTARAKGQSYWKIIIKHMLRNAIIPILTVAGMMFGRQLGGAVLVESVFAVPGLGKYLVDAIKASNYPAVQGTILFIAFSASFVTLVVDLLYAVADPRVLEQYKSKSSRKKKPVKAKEA